MTTATGTRRLTHGARFIGGAGTAFHVWAPRRSRVDVVLEGGRSHALESEPDGWFSGTIAEAGPGTRYRFRLDGDSVLPDPASRWQPEGPHGPSGVVDGSRFGWTDAAWPGVRLEGQVISEVHIGTFTPEGTWRAATAKLDELAEAGISLIELMPVADFPGDFGWGYDGVMLYAPYHAYGTPDDFRGFVDRAHALGLGVLLDVVYNHLGPDGNVWPEYSDVFFSSTFTTDWGAGLNFDEAGCEAVREFVLGNVEYWLTEFHLDGFRLDATQDIHDRSDDHILAAIARRARSADRPRVLVLAENEPQDVRLLRRVDEAGYGLDAVWNDDFHHTAIVGLTGRRQSYYSDYGGTPSEFIAAVKSGYLFQGQHYAWQHKRRGTLTRGIPRAAFVNFLENHDQLANSERGARIHTLAAPGCYRALTALLLLGPGTPLLFQGQEYGTSRPFLYFADHHPELARSVRAGRAEFLSQFPNMALPEVQAALADPGSEETFTQCKLHPAERVANVEARLYHQDLIRLRREDPVLARQGQDGLDGAVLTEDAFVLRFTGVGVPDRLLLFNLGPDQVLERAPEPLLAPPEGAAWRTAWCSEDARYGGRGCPPLEDRGRWRLPGQAAALLIADAEDPEPDEIEHNTAPEGRH